MAKSAYLISYMEFYPSRKAILVLKMKERNKENHYSEYIVEISSSKACYLF